MWSDLEGQEYRAENVLRISLSLAALKHNWPQYDRLKQTEHLDQQQENEHAI